MLQFKVTTLDVGVPEEAEEIIRIADSMAPVGGIFHLAMYLADKLVTNQVTNQGLHLRPTQHQVHLPWQL